MSTEDGVEAMDTAPPPVSKTAKKAALTVEKMYQKKSQLEHILLRPDTYIGSVEPVTELMWVYDKEQEMMVQREITYVPGLYKIFDEILVNAADNKQRDPSMNCIRINIDPEENLITIWNNGKGIPVVEHKDEKMYVPTMIFGHLLTSSNYNDEEEKVTGGRNGYGAKLCNIFSKKFTVQTSSKQYRKAFKQTWLDNMGTAQEVKIKQSSEEDYTKVSFSPDLSKFKMEKLDKDIIDLMSRRAFDVAASTRGVKVFLNDVKLPIKNFKDYIDLYIKNKDDDMGNQLKVVYENVNDRWEVALTTSEKGFQQVSFVNSIATTKGGRHVDYIAESITKQLIEMIKKKNKGGMQIKPFQVKSHMWLFVNCLIVNPTFDSQTKEHMTLQAKNFGSKCVISEKFMNQVGKSGLVEQVLTWAKFKAQTILEKAAGGKKKNKLKDVPKLDDANDAGTKHSLSCTLILTEGDSAKALAVSGLSVVGRDKYGVFPLRGKLLNVREASHKQILENAEINNIIKIMGLQYKKKYETREDMETLRYGKIMIMTDQDQDGSHIKGLIVNFIHYNWPSLIKMPFLEVFITPIIKATKRNEEISFYSIPEFDEWKAEINNLSSYKIKYYKGLGTSTSKEAKEYFSNMEKHRITFKYSGPECDQSIIMAFSKKAVEQRKEWLTNWMTERKRRKELGMPEEYLYMKDTKSITFKDFINKELVLFSNMDNERSIPNVLDGLKPGSRKVVFTCLKRNDKREIKVAQLAGSVAEHSAYHHGETSLMSTIINLAQNYVGTNNINILQPIGQFGTRLAGGKDAASPRYIFTMLSPLARLIFHPDDEPLLKYQKDDNQKIEPVWYIPVIPMVLVNGADGIGTGWMTKIPNYNPRDIIENLRNMINNLEPSIPLKPWFKNFKGEIESLPGNKFVISGEVGILDEGDKIEISELPIGVWTNSYKETVLVPMFQGSEKTPAAITDFKEYHTDTVVKFIVTMTRDKFISSDKDGFHKVFKLQNTISLSSMCAFDRDGCLKRYDSVIDIMKEYFETRLEYYSKRKAYLEGMLQAEADKLSNQARFIVEKCDGRVKVENLKRAKIIEELKNKGYRSDPIKAWKKLQIESGNTEEEDEPTEEKEAEPTVEGMDYDYLLGMSMWTLTLERKEDLINKKNIKVAELEELRLKTPADIWEYDLNELLKKLTEVEEKERQEEAASNLQTTKGAAKGKGGKKKVLMDIIPSAASTRVKPLIDQEMIKKAETANRLKEKKLKGPSKKGDAGEEGEKDQFDLLEEGVQKTLSQRLGNSPMMIEKKARKKQLKQTKLNLEKKSPKKKRNPWTDSEDDDDNFNSDDSGPSRAVSIPSRNVPRRSTASAIKFTFDSEDSDSSAGFVSVNKKNGNDFSSDEEIPKSKSTNSIPKVDTPPKASSDGGKSDDDDDDLNLKRKDEPAVDSDKLFDSLLGSGSEQKTEVQPKSKPAAKATKPKAPKKAPAVKKTVKRPKKKALSDSSDSEDMFSDKTKKKKPDEESENEATALSRQSTNKRARKAVTYTFGDDELSS
ncbi:DNA topoisomerase 2 [Cimex lectularius]|uniref:DNA topoisomerase 2 n=1 Tax=Cimex lectularius TaxID=79782 RepID=A0A8I6RL68_CIMLE|nr:DNA topoisomerase 2 [Cimex lectularius]